MALKLFQQLVFKIDLIKTDSELQEVPNNHWIIRMFVLVFVNQMSLTKLWL